MLFFLFACVGNLTYVLSILAYEPACAKIEGQNSVFGALASKGGRDIVGCEDGEWASQYLKYFLVNLSWLVGSAGTLGLDGAIFVQFWMYSGNEPSDAFA